jgi:protein arginine N-methyltransferase 5
MAWEFSHPIPQSTIDLMKARSTGGVVGGGGGSMLGAAGFNDHNSRFCHLTFVCRNKGVIHGLAGFFESVLYEQQFDGSEKVELSILPEAMDAKSKDMVSWFPIFFPMQVSTYFCDERERLFFFRG